MNHTLLLNAGFEPLRIVSWQRAFVLIFQGKVEILEEYSVVVRSVAQSFKVPAVVRLNRYVQLKRHHIGVRFSRTNLYARDEYTCQYCLSRFPEKDLTLDHVVPVVRGGRKTWDNIVTACMRCNQKKGDRAPEQVGMQLNQKPKVPQWIPGLIGNVYTKTAPPIWEPYLTSNLTVPPK